MSAYDDQLWTYLDEPAPPRRTGLVIGLSLAVFLAIGLLGVPLGWLWQHVAPDVPVRIVSDDGKLSGIVSDAQPEQFAAGDGWFVVLGLGFGVVAAIAVWALVRRLRGPVGLFVVALACVAAAMIAWRFGRDLGLAHYRDQLATAAAGTELAKPSALRITAADWWPARWSDFRWQGVLLMPALASARLNRRCSDSATSTNSVVRPTVASVV